MKRLCTALLLSVFLLLCGCSSEEEDFNTFSQDLNRKESLSFIAELRCEYEDRTLNFTLAFEGDADGCSVSVLSPKIISGIRANLRPGDTELQFEDMILNTGDLDKYGLSPLSALPELLKAMSGGNIESYYNENEYRVYKLSAENGRSAEIRLKGEGMIPVGAEIISSGEVKVFCKIAKWQ